MRGTLVLLSLLLAGLAQAQPNAIKQVYRLLENPDIFQDGFTGFALFDPDTEKMLVAQNADKHFTPASNTKVVTLYTTLQVLGDSIPAFRYATQGDTLVFWGTANPLMLHPELPQHPSVFQVLQDSSCQLFFSAHNFEDRRFGPGWAWDDYNYNFQVEKSSFPIYGNLAYFLRTRLTDGFRAYPHYFQGNLAFNPRLPNDRPRPAWPPCRTSPTPTAGTCSPPRPEPACRPRSSSPSSRWRAPAACRRSAMPGRRG